MNCKMNAGTPASLPSEPEFAARVEAIRGQMSLAD